MKYLPEIYDLIIRPTNLDTKAHDRHCEGIMRHINGQLVFELEQTKRWFHVHHFLPRTGFLLIREDTQQQYIITNIDYRQSRPKKALFTIVPIHS